MGANHDETHAGELETSILLAAHAAYARYGWRTPTMPRGIAAT
jgi:creatinine amidohydrolase